MKKGMVIVFFVSCFLLGTVYGANSNSKSGNSVSPNQVLTQEIKEYEKLLSQGEELVTTYSELVSEGVVPTSTDGGINGIAHNNISRFGQDAADLLKTTVREILRIVVRACDQLITE